MPIAIAKSGISIPAGVHEAVLVSVVDIGTQISTLFNNTSRKVILTWEIPSCLNSDGEPVTISKFYTLSISQKAALRRDIENMLNTKLKEKHLELKDLLGTPALLQLTKSENGGKERTLITAVMQLPNKKKITPFHDLISFDITDKSIPSGVADWIKEYIYKSEEWTSGSDGERDSEDDEYPIEEPEEERPVEETVQEPF